jgi:hypothetical protein
MGLGKNIIDEVFILYQSIYEFSEWLMWIKLHKSQLVQLQHYWVIVTTITLKQYILHLGTRLGFKNAWTTSISTFASWIVQYMWTKLSRPWIGMVKWLEKIDPPRLQW